MIALLVLALVAGVVGFTLGITGVPDGVALAVFAALVAIGTAVIVPRIQRRR